LLTVAQPQANHNGGQLAFGPDDKLYVALGDGGAAGDAGPGHKAGGNAQSLDNLLGKILRIDPSPSGGAQYTVPSDNPFVGRAGAAPEIWAYGLRNPWRFTFDSETGDLWIGDVGQGAWEEIDYAPAVDGRDAGRGDNFGWNRLEGTHEFSGAKPANAVPPVHELSHTDGSCSVTGGYVYRGKAIPELQGTYLFVDFCRNQILGLTPTDGGGGAGGFDPVDFGTEAASVSTFGQRNNGELFVLSQANGLYRIRAA
jgi:glucose/arabinose dehydrogenase